MSLKFLYCWFKQKLRLVSLKTLFHKKQRPLSLIKTNVLQNSRPTKKSPFHALPHCKAKSTLQLDSINTNNSISVEHNSKTLAQNKFNTRPKFYFLSKQYFSLYAALSSSSLFAFSFSSVLLRLSELYIDKSHVPTNFLVYAGLSSNSLERALR